MDKYISYEQAINNRELLDEIIDINENNDGERSIEFVYRNNRQWAIKPDREESGNG